MTRIRKHWSSSREDSNIVRPHAVVAHNPKVGDNDRKQGFQAKPVTSSDQKYHPKALTKFKLMESDINDSNQTDKVKFEKVENDAADRNGQRADSQDADGDTDTGEGKKTRVKFAKRQVRAQQIGTQSAEDRFPTGWKYKGLAQIAERNEVIPGQIFKQCGRTDGRKWRCPLRAVERLLLCEHHLKKAEGKRLAARNRHQKNQSDKRANDAALLPKCKLSLNPPASSLTLTVPVPSDEHATTIFRRPRRKTAKLSML